MTQSIRRLSLALITAFGVVALFAGYWSLWRAPGLLAREDNPRLILADQRIQRGQILDRDGVVLAHTTSAEGVAVRDYPVPGAAPVVGYDSLRYGTSGIESQFDGLLSGDTTTTIWQRLWDHLLHRNPVGGDIRLTLDADVQQVTANLLAGRQGAIVVLAVPSGDVLAMASAPTYDSNLLEENWDALRDDPAAPLLNRATQGLYQPGAGLESIVLGAAINARVAALDDPAPDSRTEIVGGVILPCASNNRALLTLADAYLNACPASFEDLGAALGSERLTAALSDFGLFSSPAFALPVESSEQIFADNESSVRETAIGQSDLTVTPLHMVSVAAAFANHGQIPPLQLLAATRLPGEAWQPAQATGSPRGTISRSNADAIAGLMAESVRTGSAQRAALSSRNVSGHAGLALTGPEETLSAWFIGFVPLTDEESYAVAVLLENTSDAGEAAALGGQVLKAAIDTR